MDSESNGCHPAIKLALLHGLRVKVTVIARSVSAEAIQESSEVDNILFIIITRKRISVKAVGL